MRIPYTSRLILCILCFLVSSSNAFSGNIDLKNIDTIRSISEFQKIANELLSNKALSKSQIGVSIYSLKQNKDIYSFNSNKTLVPASVSKLFTAFMVLSQMGGHANVTTTIYTDAKEIKPELDGNLYIYGRGDALLTVSDLEHLVSQIRQLGVVRIKGNIYCDGSFFDGNLYRFHYSGDADEVEYVPPVSALSLERNTAQVIVSSGSTANRPVNVQVMPTSAGFETHVNAKVSGRVAQPKKVIKKRKKSHSMNDIENPDEYNPFNQYFGDKLAAARPRKKAARPHKKAVRAARASVSVTSSAKSAGKQIITVTGSLPPNSNIKRWLPMTNPCLVVAGAFFERLKAAGIKIDGGLEEKLLSEVPKEKHITTIAEFRRPLNSILSVLNKNSDNYLAENMFKLIGANCKGKEDNKREAVKYYKKMFDSLDFPKGNYEFNDGSGLSRRNKASSEAIVYLLEKSIKSQFAEALDTALSIAGRDGTLRKRFIGTPAENNLHAKTGTHRDVSGLAGYVNTFSGDTFCFAILSNGWAIGEYKQLENALGELMSKCYFTHEEK